MSRPVSIRLLTAMAVLSAPAASLAADDLAALKAEIEAIRSEYTTRIASLEARIAELESSPPATAPVAAAPAPAADTIAVSSPTATAKAFNPAISVILTGNYANLSEDPETWAIAGFMPAGDELGPGERSFNLGESEITMSASIDPYFMGSMTAALTAENEVEIEEAYFRTLSLPAGLILKGGRFYSGFGYLNEIHAHAWDFIDQPLVYQAFSTRRTACS